MHLHAILKAFRLATLPLLVLPCAAQNGKPTAISAEPPRSQVITENKVPLIAQPLRLADFLSDPEKMDPTPVLAAQLTHLRDFTQTNPEEGKPGTEQTDVWLDTCVGCSFTAAEPCWRRSNGNGTSLVVGWIGSRLDRQEMSPSSRWRTRLHGWRGQF